LKPTPRVLGAVGLWLVLEWYGATSEVSWLFLLAAWIIALVGVCAVYAWWNRSGLRLHLAVRGARRSSDSPVDELPDGVLARGPIPGPLFERDDIDVEVGLDAFRGARGPAWVSGSIAGQRVHLGTGVVPRTGWRGVETLRAARRGAIGARGWRIGTSDPLGFFAGTRRCADQEVALVLPRFASLSDRREARELEASTAAPRAGAGSEMFGIREYRPGDSLRRIHWRSTARHGDLVVREYEPPGMRTLAIFLDPAPAPGDHADQVARIAASEAWDCIRDGGRVSLWAPGLEHVNASRDLWSVLEWLARYPDVPSGGSAATSPLRGDEVVVVTASANAELLDAAEASRHRRAWIVGDAEITSDVPFDRVGTAWPL
jgi:uncharacterized protein (DUF58 family)